MSGEDLNAPQKGGYMPKQVDDMVNEADKLQEELYGLDDQDLVADDEPEDDILLDDAESDQINEGFEQKYNVLKGKYDAETGRMTQMLSQTMAEKEALRIQLENKSKEVRPTGDDRFGGDSDPAIQSLITEYPSLAKGIQAYADKVVSERLKTTTAEVKAVTDQTRRETYSTKMDGAVEDWKELNNDPKFIEWLQRPDRYTGATKHQLLLRAWENFNVDASVAFFEDYKKEAGYDKRVPKSEENLLDLTPDTSKGHLPKKGSGSRTYISKAEISNFYRNRAMGKFEGTDADAAKIEARIVRAVREGKVR